MWGLELRLIRGMLIEGISYVEGYVFVAANDEGDLYLIQLSCGGLSNLS